MSGEVVKMFFLKWLPENEKNYQNRFWHSRHDNCNAMSLQKSKECAKTFLTFMTHWANTKKAYPNIIPCRIRREKSRRKKPFVRKFVLVFIFFCCASESVNEQLGLPVKKRMRSQKIKCAGKTLSFVRLMSLMQWLSFFSQQPLKQEVKHHCKKITCMAWPIEYFYCKSTV